MSPKIMKLVNERVKPEMKQLHEICVHAVRKGITTPAADALISLDVDLTQLMELLKEEK